VGDEPTSEQAARNPAHLVTDDPKIDPDLADVLIAWPTLAAAIRAGIVAMVRADGQREAVTEAAGAVLQWLAADGHGSTRQLLDEVSAILQRYDFDAFGNALRFTDAAGQIITPQQALTSLLYVGEQFDRLLKWSYNRARYYDYATGRFPTSDRYQGRIASPLTLHKYAYGHADPVGEMDPTGQVSVGLLVAVLVVLVIVVVWDLYYYNAPMNTAGQQIAGSDVTTLNVARNSGHMTLRAAANALSSPSDQTLLRVARFFSPPDAAITAVDENNRPRLMSLSKQVKATYDEILGGETGNWPVVYEYLLPGDSSYRPGVVAHTQYDEIWGISIDANEVELAPAFFADAAMNQSLTLIHEWSHAYLQTWDNDAGIGPDVYLSTAQASPMGAVPAYSSPVSHRPEHADILANFAAPWYVP
jgi:RHS repeat-associated protein